MEKARINPETGIVDTPIHPCIKGEGLCRLRVTGEAFYCAQEPAVCRYCVRAKGDGFEIS